MVHDDDDDSGVVGGGGSRRGSGSDTTYSGGGSSTSAGSGVTGDDGSDTSYSGGGDTSTDAPTGSTGTDDPSGGGSDTGGGGGDDDDDDDRSGVVGGGGSRRGDDSDTTYSGGGSDTTAGPGVTGDSGSDTTYSGGDVPSTEAPTGSTGTDDPTQADDPTAEERAADRLDGDADRGVSLTTDPKPGGGGQLEQSEQVRETERQERMQAEREEFRDAGLEEQYGALSGEEGRTAEAVQQLQGRVDRRVPGVSLLDTDRYNIVETEQGYAVDFAESVGEDPKPSPTDRRRQIAENVAEGREGVTAEDVTVTATADDYQAVIDRGDRGRQVVVTGGPERDRVETEIRRGETRDRGVGITSGPAGGEIVYPDRNAADVTRYGQQQLNAQRSPSRDEVRASVNRFGQRQLDIQRQQNVRLEDGNQSGQRELVEPREDYSAVEIATGQAGSRRYQRAVINDALDAVGLADEVGFRERRRGSSDPDPSGRSTLSYLRGAGRRRAYEVESERVGGAVESQVTSDQVLGAAAAGVAAPEPSTTLGGAAILATAGALAAGSRLDRDEPTASATATQQSELDVPEENQQPELDTPNQRGRQSELDVPADASRNELEATGGEVRRSELSPEEAGRPDELSVPAGQDGSAPTGGSQQDTVVPTDYPLAGRDQPADPSQEYVSGERIGAPTAGTSPAGQQITEEELDEADEEDDLGVPDDPFRVSDRRLYDQTRRFGDREDVSDLPEEQTPEQIDDIGSGIAGEGTAMEPARGETVEENFNRFLEDREQLQEEAQRQSVDIEDQTPPGTQEPLGRIDEAESSAIQQSQLIETETDRTTVSSLGGGVSGGIVAGGLERQERATETGVGGRGDTGLDMDVDVGAGTDTTPRSRTDSPVRLGAESRQTASPFEDETADIRARNRVREQTRIQVGDELIQDETAQQQAVETNYPVQQEVVQQQVETTVANPFLSRPGPKRPRGDLPEPRDEQLVDVSGSGGNEGRFRYESPSLLE